MTHPVVDVVLPVHTPQRPVARATASVLTTATVETRVTVVCHNVATDAIATSLGAWADDPRIRLLHLQDGVPSPAGPINAGLEAATGEFTALLGSDDEYEPGAIDTWVGVARRDNAAVVIPPLRTAPGAPSLNPPTRPFRARNLDGVRDRLAYRTVQLGLLSRSDFPQVRMTEGLLTGEDVIQGATLWYSGAPISMVRHGPGYLIHQDDPEGRTSVAHKPAEESLRFLDAVLAPEFVARLTVAQRESFGVKILRTTVLDVLGAALDAETLERDRAALANAVQRVLNVAPTAINIVSARDSRLLRSLADPGEGFDLASERMYRTQFWRPANVFPASARYLLHREAPLRFLAAFALMR